MSEKTRNSIILQGSILAMAGIISKIIGFLYRIPMANIMGNDGNGLYSVSFGIYNVALTLSSYSMPLAVSKLMSARIAEGRYKDAHRLFTRAVIFALCTGLIAAGAMFFGAEQLAGIYKRPGLERPIRVLAPTVLVVAILGTFRGYFQGHKNMVPTALSQVVEQVVNAIVSVCASYGFIKAFATGDNAASFGAMGGTLGTLVGAYVALLIFVFLFVVKKSKVKAEMNRGDEATEDNRLIYKCILMTVIPVIISQTIYQFGYTLDDLLYGNILEFKGVDSKVATSLQGIFNTQYNQMINLPVAIATSMASAMLPSVVAHFTVGEHHLVKKKVNMVFKLNMIIAIPSAVGLAVLADPIMSVLFPKLGEYHDVAVILLSSGSSAVVFYALSTLSTSVLQGCDKMNVPVLHSGISLVIHGVLNGFLLYHTDLGVYALVIGNVTFPLLVCILNLLSVKKYIGYRMDYFRVMILPFISSIFMGITAHLVYKFVLFVSPSDNKFVMACGLVAAIGSAMIIYMQALVMTKAVSYDELRQMPIIKKFVRKQ